MKQKNESGIGGGYKAAKVFKQYDPEQNTVVDRAFLVKEKGAKAHLKRNAATYAGLAGGAAAGLAAGTGIARKLGAVGLSGKGKAYAALIGAGLGSSYGDGVDGRRAKFRLAGELERQKKTRGMADISREIGPYAKDPRTSAATNLKMRAVKHNGKYYADYGLSAIDEAIHFFMDLGEMRPDYSMPVDDVAADVKKRPMKKVFPQLSIYGRDEALALPDKGTAMVKYRVVRRSMDERDGKVKHDIGIEVQDMTPVMDAPKQMLSRRFDTNSADLHEFDGGWKNENRYGRLPDGRIVAEPVKEKGVKAHLKRNAGKYAGVLAGTAGGLGLAHAGENGGFLPAGIIAGMYGGAGIDRLRRRKQIQKVAKQELSARDVLTEFGLVPVRGGRTLKQLMKTRGPIKITRKAETGEFLVHPRGVREGPKTYYTDAIDDARDTAASMLRYGRAKKEFSARDVLTEFGLLSSAYTYKVLPLHEAPFEIRYPRLGKIKSKVEDAVGIADLKKAKSSAVGAGMDRNMAARYRMRANQARFYAEGERATKAFEEMAKKYTKSANKNLLQGRLFKDEAKRKLQRAGMIGAGVAGAAGIAGYVASRKKKDQELSARDVLTEFASVGAPVRDNMGRFRADETGGADPVSMRAAYGIGAGGLAAGAALGYGVARRQAKKEAVKRGASVLGNGIRKVSAASRMVVNV